MSQPIKINASLEGPLFRNMGSFWTSVFQEQDKVRVLLDVGLRTRLLSSFKQAVHNMAGDPALGVLISQIQIPFKANEIIETGMQLYDDPDKEFNYGDLDDFESSYGNFRIRYFALQMGRVLPLSIHADQGTLILGVDFFLHKNLIYFRQDPRKLFVSGSYLVTQGLELGYRSYLSFFTQNSLPGIDDLVVRYLRQAQTPQNFYLALCAVAGLGILRKTGQLKTITQTFNGDTIYTFEQESVRVNYLHAPLEIGVIYPALMVIGDLIKVAQAEIKETAWWRKIDWKGGLILDPIVAGVRNLPIVDTDLGVAYVAGQDAGSSNGNRVHTRVQLSEDFESELPYWQEVARQETASGHYLNHLLGLPEEKPGTYDQHIADTEEANWLNLQLKLPPEQPSFRALPGSKMVNPLDVFFQAVMGQTAFVVAIDQLHTPRQHEVFNFLTREMLIGGTPIIIGFISGLEDDALELGDDDSVVITHSGSLQVTDDADLDSNDELVYVPGIGLVLSDVGDQALLNSSLGSGNFHLIYQNSIIVDKALLNPNLSNGNFDSIYQNSIIIDRARQNSTPGLGQHHYEIPTDLPHGDPTAAPEDGWGRFGPIFIYDPLHEGNPFYRRMVGINPGGADPYTYLEGLSTGATQEWCIDTWNQFVIAVPSFSEAHFAWAWGPETDANFPGFDVYPGRLGGYPMVVFLNTWVAIDYRL